MSFGDLDKLRDRAAEAGRHKDRVKPPVITTAEDIRHVLLVLDPAARFNTKSDDVQLAAQMEGTDQHNNRHTFKVSIKTKIISHRDILLAGFNMLKQRQMLNEDALEAQIPIKVDGAEMLPPAVLSNPEFISIDPIIKRLLGGYRKGCFIQWDLVDGYTYKYDIYGHRLTRFLRGDEIES